MSRKVAVTLALAMLMFVLAPATLADLIFTPTGVVLIPEGSQVTSQSVIGGFGNCQNNVEEVDFKFQGGTGSTISCLGVEGNLTTIEFTVPVTDLSLTAIISPANHFASLTADNGFVFECSDDPAFPPPCPVFGSIVFGSIELTLGGPISFLQLVSNDDFSGIESLTVDAGDPPTSSLVLLGFGLIGLLVSFRRKVPICP